MRMVGEMVADSQATEETENQRQDLPQISLVGSTQEMADVVAKVDEKVFESLFAEIKKSIQQTRLDVDLHNKNFQQLKGDVLKTTEDLLSEEREEMIKKLQRELNNYKQNLTKVQNQLQVSQQEKGLAEASVQKKN